MSGPTPFLLPAVTLCRCHERTEDYPRHPQIKREGADEHTIRMPNPDCQSRREGEELVFIWFGGEGRFLQIMDFELWVESEKFRKR